MKMALRILALSAVVALGVGCADPCGELKDECANCKEPSNCEAAAELLDLFGGGDACQEALDKDDVCGEAMTN